MWKEIKNFEDYLINENGEIKSKDRIVEYSCGWSKLHKGKIITPHLTENGYLFVALYKDKKKYQKKVHRLVAETFIENPNNLPCVNHKDENKQNNSVENLEWCDVLYNNTYGTRLERQSKSIKKTISIPILQIDLNTSEVIKEWESAKSVNEELGYSDSNIRKCCNGIYNSAYGFKWVSKP